MNEQHSTLRLRKEDSVILRVVKEHGPISITRLLEFLDSQRPSSPWKRRPLRSVETHERELRRLCRRLELLCQHGFVVGEDTSTSH